MADLAGVQGPCASGGQQGAPKWVDVSVSLLAALIVLVSLTWALQLPSRLFNIALHAPQFMSVVLAAAATIVFLTYPLLPGKEILQQDLVTKPSFRPGVLGFVLANASVLVFGYIAVHYERLLFDIPRRTPELLLISVASIALLLEALRRSAGLPLFLIVLGFIAYALVGHLFGGALSTRNIPWERLVIYLSMDLSALFGSPVQIGMAVVVIYILLGQTLLKAGGGNFFTDFALATVGNRKGGPAKTAIVGSALFGSISGVRCLT